MNPADRERLADTGWLRFLDGKNPSYPEQALAADFLAIRGHIAGLRADRTTPATRLADDPMAYNPATVPTLVNLMLGGLYPGHVGSPLHCRVRYFDPEKRRAGLPDDVAALVDHLSDKETGLTLVNISPLADRTVVVQGGAYGEHRFVDVTVNGKSTRINASTLTVDLAPSSGARLLLRTKRYVNAPTMSFPWKTDTVARAERSASTCKKIGSTCKKIGSTCKKIGSTCKKIRTSCERPGWSRQPGGSARRLVAGCPVEALWTNCYPETVPF